MAGRSEIISLVLLLTTFGIIAESQTTPEGITIPNTTVDQEGTTVEDQEETTIIPEFTTEVKTQGANLTEESSTPVRTEEATTEHIVSGPSEATTMSDEEEPTTIPKSTTDGIETQTMESTTEDAIVTEESSTPVKTDEATTMTTVNIVSDRSEATTKFDQELVTTIPESTTDEVETQTVESTTEDVSRTEQSSTPVSTDQATTEDIVSTRSEATTLLEKEGATTMESTTVFSTAQATTDNITSDRHEATTAFSPANSTTVKLTTTEKVLDTLPTTVNSSAPTTSLITDTDDCVPYPCENDGTCSDQGDSYMCQCVAGFEGENCEINTDDCASFRCQHGSTCIDGLRSYTCECRPRFFGDLCENYCETDSDCDNGGSCDQGECVCASCESHGKWCEDASQCFENSLTLEELGGEPIEFTANLNDPTSERFQDLVNRITPLIDSLLFATTTVFKYYYSDSLVITGFEEGSVQVNYQFQITAEASLTPEDVQKDIQQAISEDKVPQLGVKEGSLNANEIGGPPNTQPTKVFVYLGSGITLFVIMCIFIRYAGNSVLRADKEHQLMLHFLTAFSGLLIMFVLLVIFVDSTIKGLDVNKTECSVLAGFTHYFYLVSGALTVAQTVSITRYKFTSGTTAVAVFAWGIPLILVPIMGAVAQDNYAEQQFCMLAEEVLLVTLVAPLGVFLLINIVLYFKSLQHSKTKLVPVKQVKKNVVILLLVAFTWTSGILSFIPGVPVVTTRPLFFVCCAVLAFAFIMVYAKTEAKSLEIYTGEQAEPEGIELADIVVENDTDSETKDKTRGDSGDVMDSQNAEEEPNDKEDDKQDKDVEKDDIENEDKTTEDAELIKNRDEEKKEGINNEGFETEEGGNKERLI